MTDTNFFTSDFANWFQLTGSILAFVLTIFAIIDFRKKRVKLVINLEQDEIKSFHNEDTDTDETIIQIKLDIMNKGLEPTTITGATFYSNYEELNKVPVDDICNMNPGNMIYRFDYIRMDANDRIEQKLWVRKSILLPEKITKINGKIIFRTSLGEKKSNIKLNIPIKFTKPIIEKEIKEKLEEAKRKEAEQNK